jgi:AcrR family transcriptional regulator
MQAKLQRQQALSDARRTLVLDAARAVFLETGIGGANIREIAKRAGYTPGAIYSYFDSKEAIYAALLAESMEALGVAVASARAFPARPDKTLVSRALAWFGYYFANPRHLELGLDADAKTVLHDGLFKALRPCEAALVAMGLSPVDALRETTALFAHGLGLLALQRAGRLPAPGLSAQALFKNYVEQLAARHRTGEMPATTPDGEDATPLEQVDLFNPNP